MVNSPLSFSGSDNTGNHKRLSRRNIKVGTPFATRAPAKNKSKKDEGTTVLYMPILCTIKVNGIELQGAVCPVCRAKRYPPEDALACVARHEEIARGCHQPRPKKEFKLGQWLCLLCRKKPTVGPYARGKGIPFQEYLTDNTYSWEG